MSLLDKSSLPRQMWDAFREMMADLMAGLGMNANLGRSFDTQVNDLKRRARDAALRGGRPAEGAAQGNSLPAMGGPAGWQRQR